MAKIVIRPDMSEFKNRLERQAKESIAGINGSVPVRLEFDESSAARTRQEAERAVGHVDSEARVKLNRASAVAAREEAKRTVGDITTHARVVHDRNATRRLARDQARDHASAYARERDRLGRREKLAADQVSRAGKLSPSHQRLADAMRRAARLNDEDRATVAANRARVSAATQELRNISRAQAAVDRAEAKFNANHQKRLNALRQRLSNSPIYTDQRAGRAQQVSSPAINQAREKLNARAQRAARELQQAEKNLASSQGFAGQSDRDLRTARAAFRAAARRQAAELSAARTLPAEVESVERPTARVRRLARRLSLGRPVEDLPLQGDRTAITNATRSAMQLETAERALTRTRAALAKATADVGEAEREHSALVKSGTTDVDRLGQATEKVRSARSSKAHAEADARNASDLVDINRNRVDRDTSALVRRINMPKVDRLFESVDTSLERRLDAVGEKVLFIGRMLSSVATIGMTAGLSLAAVGAVNLVPVVASITQMATALAAVPAVAAAVGAAIGAIAVGFTGLKDAFKAQSDLRNQSAYAAEQQADREMDAQRKVESSQRDVNTAIRDAARTRADGADRIAASERSVQDAQRNAIQAQKDLNSARRAAVDRIDDMNRALRGVGLSERQAETRVLRARQRFTELSRRKDSTWLDYREAQDDYEQAIQDQQDLIASNRRLQRDAATTNAKGVEGDDTVVSAKQRVVDSIRSVNDAEKDRAKTARDAAFANADAQQRVTDALERQRDAVRDLSKAFKNEAQTKYEEALSKLAPNARAFVEQIGAMGGAWKDLRLLVQDNLFAGLDREVQHLGDRGLPTLKSGLAGIAGEINGGLRKSLRLLSTDAAQADLERFFGKTTTFTRKLSDAFAPLTNSVLGLFTSGSEFLPRIGQSIADQVTKFDQKVAKMRQSGELYALIDSGIERAKLFGRVLGDSFGVVKDLFKAIGMQGDSMLEAFENRLKALRQRMQSEDGQAGIREFFTAAKEAWDRLWGLLSNIGRLLNSAVLEPMRTFGSPVMTILNGVVSALAAIDKYTHVIQAMVGLFVAMKSITLVRGLGAALAGLATPFVALGRMGLNRVGLGASAGRGLSAADEAMLMSGVSPAAARAEAGVGRVGQAAARLRTFASNVGSAFAAWSPYLAAAAIGMTIVADKASNARDKMSGIKDALARVDSTQKDFSAGVAKALSDSGSVADEKVRGLVQQRVQWLGEQLRTIQDMKVSGGERVSAQLQSALGAIFAGDAPSSWASTAQANKVANWAGDVLRSMEQLKGKIGSETIIEGIVGKNDEWAALQEKIRQVAGPDADRLIAVYTNVRNGFVDAAKAATQMAGAYEDIYKNSLRAADAVSRLTGEFKRQRDDAMTVENAENLKRSSIDSFNSLLAGSEGIPGVSPQSVVQDTGLISKDTEAGRNLFNNIEQLQSAFDQSTATAYVDTWKTSQSKDQAQAALEAEANRFRAELRQNLIGSGLDSGTADKLLDRYGFAAQFVQPPNIPAPNAAGQASQPGQPAAQPVDPNPYKVNLTTADKRNFDAVSRPDRAESNRKAALDALKSKGLENPSREALIDFRANLLKGLAAMPEADDPLFSGHTGSIQLIAGLNALLGLDSRDIGAGPVGADQLPATSPLNTQPGLPGQSGPGVPSIPAAPAPAQPAPAAPPTAPQPTAAPPTTPAPSGAPQPPPEKPKVPDVPDFTGASTTFNAFSADVQKGWTEKIQPALSDLTAKAAAVGQAVVDASAVAEPAFDNLIKLFVDKISGREGLLAAWGSLKTGIDTDITTITNEYWQQNLGAALTQLATNFASSVSGVAVQWAGIKKAIAEPLNWVLNNIFNVALKNAWTQLRTVIPSLPEWNITVPLIQGFATGGIMSGYSPGVDDRVIAVGGGEAVMRPEWVRAVGPDYVHGANAAARSGGVSGVRRWTDALEHYATGGIVQTSDPIEPIQQSLWDAVRTAFPNATLTSAKRFQETGAGFDYHMQGKAIDLGGPMDEIARWIYQRYPQSTELIHWPLAGWQNLKNGRPLDYGQPTNDQHRDHLHWANLGPILSDGRMVSMAAGDAGAFVSDLQTQIDSILVQPLQQAMAQLPDFGTSLLGGALPTDLGKTVAGAAIEAVQKLGSTVGYVGPYNLSGGVEQWRPLVEKILREKGQNLAEVDRVLMQMQSESGGNPQAINLWDSNALAGHPSKGLMQVIDPTFAAYKDAGYDNIWDPESNIRAAINYALRDPKYGSLAAAFQGHGYDNGGWLPDGGIGWNKSGSPEPVFTADQWQTLEGLVGRFADFMGALAPMSVAALPVAIVELSARFVEKMKGLLEEVFGKKSTNGTAQSSQDSASLPSADLAAADTGTTTSVAPGDSADVPPLSLLPEENPNIGEDVLRDVLSDALSPSQLDAMFPSTAPKKPQAPAVPTQVPGSVPSQTLDVPGDAGGNVLPLDQGPLPIVPEASAVPDAVAVDPAAQAVQPQARTYSDLVQPDPAVTNQYASQGVSDAKFATLTPNAVAKRVAHMGLGFIDANVRQFLGDVGLPGGGALSNALDEGFKYKREQEQRQYAASQANVTYNVSDIDEAMRKETIRRWQESLGYRRR
ncbi:transglycosylase SLT domain-containing protein [Nocardia vinacea]|uniref:transglycosylase SLT domain-containing protein n=1 Tax=Nocardia vinacea TaxID=96468 RepID=UPI0033F263F4